MERKTLSSTYCITNEFWNSLDGLKKQKEIVLTQTGNL